MGEKFRRWMRNFGDGDEASDCENFGDGRNFRALSTKKADGETEKE